VTALLLSWLIMSVIVLITAWIVPGVMVRGLFGALWISLLLGVFNVLLGWILFVVIGIGTLGIGFILAFATRWLVDAILLYMVAGLTRSLEIASFGRAFLAAMVMSGLGTLAEWLLRSNMFF
jgi:putative membrane protein